MRPNLAVNLILTILLSGFSLKVQGMPNTCAKWRTLPLKEDNFKIAYDGFGQIHFGEGLTLQPAAVASAQKPSQESKTDKKSRSLASVTLPVPASSISNATTHAALVLLNDKPLRKNFGLRIQYKNEKTFRKPAANTWEVFWVFFNYQAQEKGKKTNYFIFKPNGIELGKAWGEIDQEFLKTENSPKVEIGKDYELTLFKEEQNIHAYIDGKLVLKFNEGRDRSLFNEAGQIGLYTEDAQVKIHKIEICDLD